MNVYQFGVAVQKSKTISTLGRLKRPTSQDKHDKKKPWHTNLCKINHICMSMCIECNTLIVKL